MLHCFFNFVSITIYNVNLAAGLVECSSTTIRKLPLLWVIFALCFSRKKSVPYPERWNLTLRHLTYTPGSSNIAGWKMGSPDGVDVWILLNMGMFQPASCDRLPGRVALILHIPKINPPKLSQAKQL